MRYVLATLVRAYDQQPSDEKLVGVGLREAAFSFSPSTTLPSSHVTISAVIYLGVASLLFGKYLTVHFEVNGASLVTHLCDVDLARGISVNRAR